ncbi:hypothetical protein [Collimonas fungivorans]|nr:hypothetical protein [Collimonas fungivorans]
MATVLFLVGFLGLMIFPSKYISVGGYGFLLSALSVSLIMLGKGDELHEWSFWAISILAIGCIGHWLKDVYDKNKR